MMGTIRDGVFEAIKTQIESGEGVSVDCKSPVIYTFIISCTCGCEWGLSCTHPGTSPLLVFGEWGQSPGPKVWH